MCAQQGLSDYEVTLLYILFLALCCTYCKERHLKKKKSQYYYYDRTDQ